MLPRATKRMLQTLLLCVFAGSTLGDGGCDCEAFCAQTIAQQREKIAQLEAEISALRGATPRALASSVPCDGDWVVASDADVEALEGCRSVNTLTVSGDSVTSLAGLASLESAENVLVLETVKLKSLAGLEKLSRVEKKLELRGNVRLESIAELQGLHTAAEVLIDSNGKLKTLDGLQGLTHAGNIKVGSNARLESLVGLESLTSVAQITIEENHLLKTLTNFANLKTVASLTIHNNDELESLAGLENIANVGDKISIESCWSLTTLTGLEGLETATNLAVRFNAHLESLTALQNLRSVQGRLLVQSNRFVESLSGLEGLQRVGAFEIASSGGLRRLAALDGITSLELLRLESLAGLESYDGFGSLRTVNVLRLMGSNYVLSLTAFRNVHVVKEMHIDRCTRLRSLVGPDFTTLDVLHIEQNYELRSIAGLENLTRVDQLTLKNGAMESLDGLQGLKSVRRLEMSGFYRSPPSLAALSGLESLHELHVLDNKRGSESLAGLELITSIPGGITIRGNTHFHSLSGLEFLLSTGILDIANNEALESLGGLESLMRVEKLALEELNTLKSLAGLRNLASSPGGVIIKKCGQLRSLEGLGALGNISELHVEETPLKYLGGPFTSWTGPNVVRFDDLSWPSCLTPQEHEALVRGAVVHVGVSSTAAWPQWRDDCPRANFGTFLCTRGQPCGFSLDGKRSGYTSIFISRRFTGCGLCPEDRPQAELTAADAVDLGYALNYEEGGLYSICRCAGTVELGPVAQLMLRGPRQSGSVKCIDGINCTFELNGEGLEPTDRVVVMNNCEEGNPLSGFAASWVAQNVYVLHDRAWYAAHPNKYQVCWRAPCSSAVDGPTCPPPEDRYFHVGEVELVGAFYRHYTVVLGDHFVAANIGRGVSDNDWMRIARACGEASEENDAPTANSSGQLFDFGRLEEESVLPGSRRLCWCQQGSGVECNADEHFRAEAGEVRILCQAGREPTGSSGHCQACPAGRQKLEPGLEPCSECPAGQYSGGGGERCQRCQDGTVADLTGSSACTDCRAWQSADAEAAGCSANLGMLFLFASFCLSVGALCALLVHTVKKGLVVVDVSLDQNCTIITTLGSHGLSNFGRPSFPVTLHHTGHPGLDKPSKPFRVKVRDAARLELLTGGGKSIDRRMDTSMGTLVVKFPHDLYHQGWPASTAMSLPALLIAALALGGWVLGEGMVVEGLLGAAAAALVFSAAAAAVRLRQHTTPLAQRLSAFQQKLTKEHRRYSRRSLKGPDRAIAIGKLHELLEFFRDFIRDRAAYYLESNVLRQLTKADKVSYAEYVGAEQVEWFVSHFWGTAFEHFCMALQKHAQMACGNRQWTTLRYWICFCSNNQHQIQEELGEGWQESSFYLTLKSGCCHGTCMVLDDKALPLTRVWCIFELLQTVKLAGSVGNFQGLFLCTSSGVLNTGSGSVEVAMALAEKVADMDLETAQATQESDALMIRQQVIKEMGSYSALNHFIRREVCNMLTRAQHSANEQFAAVLAHLGANADVSPFVPV